MLTWAAFWIALAGFGALAVGMVIIARIGAATTAPPQPRDPYYYLRQQWPDWEPPTPEQRAYDYEDNLMAARAGRNVWSRTGGIIIGDDPPTITWEEYQRWRESRPPRP